jgi:hypothetical protein
MHRKVNWFRLPCFCSYRLNWCQERKAYCIYKLEEMKQGREDVWFEGNKGIDGEWNIGGPWLKYILKVCDLNNEQL